MFLRLHHEIPGMRIGVENGFGKSGKQRIQDKASKNKPGSIAPGFVVERSVEKRNALNKLHKDSPIDRDADGGRDADAAVELVKGARLPQIRRLSDEVDFAEQRARSISKRFRQGGREIGSDDDANRLASFSHPHEYGGLVLNA
jgi:hypothetical protein